MFVTSGIVQSVGGWCQPSALPNTGQEAVRLVHSLTTIGSPAPKRMVMTPQGIYQPRRSARLLWLATPLFARLSPKLTQHLPALNHLSAASEGEFLFLHRA